MVYNYSIIVKENTASTATLPDIKSADYDTYALDIAGTVTAVVPTNGTGGLSVPIPAMSGTLNGSVYTLSGTKAGVSTDLATGKIYVTVAPSGGGGDGTVTVDNITDATDPGRQVLTAVSLGAIRAMIGAGTSNLVLGTTAGTAQDAAASIDTSRITDFNTAVNALISNVVNGAPAALDTLNELAAALGDDANFAATVTAQLAGKANVTDVYTKTQVDTSLATKADTAGTYTKTQVDSSLAGKVGVDTLVKLAPRATGTDQLTDLQSAINGAVTLGLTLALNGDHVISDQLSLPAGTKIDGSRGSLKVTATSTRRAILIQNVSNVHLSDLVIDMNSAATTDGGDSNNQQGIYVNASTPVSNISMRNVTVQNGHQNGIAVAESAGGTIDNVVVHGCRAYSLGGRGLTIVLTRGSGLSVNDFQSNDTGLQGIVVTGGRDVSIVDSHVTNPGDQGIVLGGVSGYTVERANIVGCSATGAAKYGIAVSWNVTNWTVVGCHGTNCGYGGITVDVEHPDALGVIQSAPGSIVGGSYSGATGGRGVQVRMATNVSVSGVTSTGNSAEGFYLASSKYITLSGCTATGNATGVRANGLNENGGHLLSGNSVHDNTVDFDIDTASIPLVTPIGSMLLRDNAGVLEKSTDGGTTWTPVDTTGGTGGGITMTDNGDGTITLSDGT